MRFLKKILIIPLFIFGLAFGMGPSCVFALQNNGAGVAASGASTILHHGGGHHGGGHGPHGGCWR